MISRSIPNEFHGVTVQSTPSSCDFSGAKSVNADKGPVYTRVAAASRLQRNTIERQFYKLDLEPFTGMSSATVEVGRSSFGHNVPATTNGGSRPLLRKLQATDGPRHRWAHGTPFSLLQICWNRSIPPISRQGSISISTIQFDVRRGCS